MFSHGSMRLLAWAALWAVSEGLGALRKHGAMGFVALYPHPVSVTMLGSRFAELDLRVTFNMKSPVLDCKPVTQQMT